MVTATVTGVGWVTPAVMPQQELWDGFFAHHYQGSDTAARVWQRSGVVTRHGVVDPRYEDVSGWGTGARMRRFVAEALPLGKEAVTSALADADLDAADVEQFTVVSCTGYATPGLDILLARDLGMPSSVQRLHIGHMGCYAAVPGLAAVADTAAARRRPGVLLCVELTSLHIQPPTDDPQQMVAHALFSDAAAAVTVVPDGHGLAVVDIAARTDVERASLMTWDVTDLGFRMGLSPKVPDVLREHVADTVLQLLAAHGLAVADVAAWVVHPGGPRIVEAVAERLGLDDDAVEDSRAVLRDHGNCSSATVLLILDRLRRRRRLERGDHLMMLAFGPGLTLYAALLRQE